MLTINVAPYEFFLSVGVVLAFFLAGYVWLTAGLLTVREKLELAEIRLTYLVREVLDHASRAHAHGERSTAKLGYIVEKLTEQAETKPDERTPTGQTD